jgi:outer membrane protein OmpA-like peptidoglycan-associated protein
MKRISLSKILLFVFVGVCPLQVFSQNLIRGIDKGIHFRGTYGMTDLSDQGLSPLVQPFIRHQLGWNTQGELSVGIGTLRGYDYTTRILPIDYKLLYFPFDYRSGFLFSRLNPGDVYLFAGLGAVNYALIEVPRPNDPLTVDAGPKIRTSEFWDFSKNWALHVPIGIGTSFHLDDQTQLVLSSGYQITSASKLESFDNDGLDGYFAVSVGLKFSRPFRMPRRSVPVSTPQLWIQPAPVQIAEVADPGPREVVEAAVVLADIPVAINFDLLRADIRPDDVEEMNIVLSHLQAKPDIMLHLRGHTDVRGRIPLNDVLGIERAWQTKRWLMERGIASDRILVTAAGATEPIADNRTEEGRFRNRRVEFELLSALESSQIRESLTFELSNAAARIQPEMVDVGQTIAVIQPRLARMGVSLDEVSIADLDRLTEWLHQYPDIRIRIVGHTDSRGSERVNDLFSLARASRIQAYLLSKGISLDRMDAVGAGSTQPVSSNATEEGRRQNRRIELIRIP